MNRELLTLYGLKWNPFATGLPLDSLMATPAVESFCRRVEHHLMRTGGFALITGEPGTGKSVALRLLAQRLARTEGLRVAALIRRIARTLVRAGVLVEDPEQPFLDLPLDSPLEQLSGATVRYVIAVGPQAGRATMRLQFPAAGDDTPELKKPFTVVRDGFSLNCAVACEAHERAKLERLCRYMARPPIAEERLNVDGDGLVVLELKRAFRDGTTHVLFEPEDFIARLAALVPRPRAHLVRYHGLFAPRARHRHLIVARPSAPTGPPGSEQAPSARTAPMSWMARLQRVWAIDLSRCPQCGGDVRVIATVTEPAVIPRILEHLRRRELQAREPRGPAPLAA